MNVLCALKTLHIKWSALDEESVQYPTHAPAPEGYTIHGRLNLQVDTAQRWKYAFAPKLQNMVQTSTNLIDQVAWLYNIRWSDVSYSPVVHAFAIVTTNSAFLYVENKKLSSENSVELEGLKNAHIRDGAAVVQYFVWVDNKMRELMGLLVTSWFN
ncbi:hypothetical protein ACFE04_006217 [Oxalis oulophora]